MLWVNKVAKKRTIDKASIAVLKTHVEYIRESIDKLDEQLSYRIKWGTSQMDQISKNFKAMDDRVQALEDWVKNYEKTEEKGFKSKSLKLACIGLAVSTAINIIVIILNLLGVL